MCYVNSFFLCGGGDFLLNKVKKKSKKTNNQWMVVLNCQTVHDINRKTVEIKTSAEA